MPSKQGVGALTTVSCGLPDLGYVGNVGIRWESEREQEPAVQLCPLSRTFLEARRQFLLSQIVSLAIKEELEIAMLSDVSIKWPNDIYWKDKKICGMLIENDLMGRNISQSISGIGINVNQEVFHSTAPNPVSLRQITGKQYDIFEILKNIMLRIQSDYELLRNGDTELIAHRYEKALFRKEGMHRYKDADGEFFARIICVEPEGKLILEDDAQKKRGYMFKEVEYLLI